MNNLKIVYFENGSYLEIFDDTVICIDQYGQQQHLSPAGQKILRTLAKRINYPVNSNVLYESYNEDAFNFDEESNRKTISKQKQLLPIAIRTYMKAVTGVGYKLIGTIKSSPNSPLHTSDSPNTAQTNDDPDNIFNNSFCNDLNNGDTPFQHAIDFLKYCANNDKEIDSIDMAFHSGWDWLKGDGKGQFLRDLDSKGIKIRVIANHRDVIIKIAETMSDPDMKEFYTGFNEGIEKWQNCVNMRKHLELRISDYPIFRKIYIVNYKDGTREALMRDYAYNYSTEYDYGKILLNNDDVSLKIFKREFEFLWTQGLTYEQWSQKTSLHEKKLTPAEYILLYHSNKKTENSTSLINNTFVISTLHIGTNNDVKLEVNSAYGKTLKLSELKFTEPEYTYHGKAKVTDKNIFITLSDEIESVSLTISKPVHDNKRLLGILTAVSEHAQPVALKFACFKPNLIDDIDLQQLSQLLKHSNEMWKSNLMILEEQDISLFYSNRIFTRDHSR